MPRARCRTANEGGDIRPIRKPETIVALLLVIIATFGVAQIARAEAPTGPTGPTIEVGEPIRPPCTVAASAYNRHARKLNTLKGRHRGDRHYRRAVNKRVACAKYRALKIRVKAARADCWEASNLTGASFYSHGDSGGLTGACGDYLPNRSSDWTFAVLRTGNVPSDCGQVLWFTAGGEWYRGHQADTGHGGGSVCDGGRCYPRSLDFWNPSHGGGLAMEARALGLTTAGLAVVRYSKRNCGA